MKNDRLDPALLVARLDALEHVVMVLLNTHQDPKAILDAYGAVEYIERRGMPNEELIRTIRMRYHAMVIGISEARMRKLRSSRTPRRPISRVLRRLRMIGLRVKLRSLR